MKHFFSLFIVIAIVKVTLAQTINLNHQFQGTSFSNISKGNNKVGFVTYDTLAGAPYIVNYMDSLQNIVSTIDTNIKIPDYNPFSGDVLLVTEMDPNGHLWGLFFDRSYYQILNPPGATTNIFTYFLYDFDNHQKHYLDVQPFTQPPFNYGPVDGSLNNINFLNDTIYITMGMTDFLFPSSKQIIVRWSNGNQISIGEIGAMAPKVVMGYNNKLTHLFNGNNLYQTLGYDVNNNLIGYDVNLAINDTQLTNMSTETYNGCTHNGSTYSIGFAYDFFGTNPSFEYLIIKNDFFDTVINIPTSGLNIYASVSVDQSNRVWIYDGMISGAQPDSLFMYDGMGWHAFSLQGLSLWNNSNLSSVPMRISIVEYAHNRYMINLNKYGFPSYGIDEIGNGIIFFDYVDTLTANLNHIQGKVFLDANNNGIYDIGETLIANQIVSAGATFSNTLNNGIYNLYVANGVQTVTTANTSPFFTPVPASHNFNFSTQTDTSGIDFAMQHTGPAINDLRIDLTAGIHRIFQTIWYSLTYKNTGSAAASGTVAVQFDPLLSFSNSFLPPTTSGAGFLTWDFTNLQPFESRQIYFYLNANNNFSIGDTVYAQADITPLVGDAIPANNTDSTMSIFVGAYDPNMKEVTQNGMPVNTIVNDDPLEYIIHFQNVGNDTAFTVVITDTISNLLDLSSLEIIGSSHTYNMGIYNRTLQFTFTGINLPDSATNQLASKGFISYRIKPVANISMGNVINNTAAIYFDVNAPVITNNAQVTLIDVTGVKEELTSNIQVVPNPAQQIIYILGKNYQNQSATIYDALGKVVLRSGINSNQSIDINGLSKGIYFVELAGQRTKFVKE